MLGLWRGRSGDRIAEVRLRGLFENELRIRIDYGITKLRPITVDTQLGKQLGFKVKEGSVMLYLEQIDYDPDRIPLILSHEYHVADFCEFTIYRKH